MTAFDIFVIAYLLTFVAIINICAWIKDDGHKKLLAIIIRRVESYKRKRKKKSRTS